MPIIFEEHTSRMGGKHLMSDEPFAVIRESGEIYLSGDYTIEELRAIIEAAEHRVQPTLLESPREQTRCDCASCQQELSELPQSG